MRKEIMVGVLIGAFGVLLVLGLMKLVTGQAEAQVTPGTSTMIMTPGVPQEGHQPIFVLMKTGVNETLLVYDYGGRRNATLRLVAARSLQYDKSLISLNTTPSLSAVYNEALKEQKQFGGR